MKNIVIDIHAHFIPRLLYERFDAKSAKFPGVKLLRDEKGIRMQFPGGEPTLADYDLVNAIGRLADSSIAVSRLLFSEHLLKFPGMKFVLSHGGAALPYALGRLARNHANSQGKYADPRKGFEAMYFDSCVFDADSLEYLARKASPARIMLGSDQPFPIGDPTPRKVVEGATFSEAQRKGILGETAQSVFRVRPDCWCPR